MTQVRRSLEDLVRFPAESSDLEIKNWIDPDSLEGAYQIVKACLALYNTNGGFLLIGFNGKTKEPDPFPRQDSNVRAQFDEDKLQHLVNYYASRPIDLRMHFVERDGQLHPVIEVGSGVSVPVVTKRSLLNSDAAKGNKKKGPLFEQNVLFVRTTASNFTHSSAPIGRDDWERLTTLWFDNREADVGRFLRRQLASVDDRAVDALRTLLRGVGADVTSLEQPSLEQDVMASGLERFQGVVSERGEEVPEIGYFAVAAATNFGDSSHEADRPFLDLLMSRRRHIGIPPPAWTMSRMRLGPKPDVRGGSWEQLHWTEAGPLAAEREIQFWRINPLGRFFMIRGLREDLDGAEMAANRFLYTYFPVWWVGESVVTVLDFLRAMSFPQEETTVSFLFRWSGMAKRTLDPSHGRGPVHGPYQAMDDEISSEVFVPLSTPDTALAPYVYKAAKKLYNAFQGFDVPENQVEKELREMLRY